MTKASDAIKALAKAESEGSGQGMKSGWKVPHDRIVVGGFSQGGAISYLAGLSSYAQDNKPFAGIMALSTWCPMRKSVSSWFEGKPVPGSGNAAPLPVFGAHGTADPVVRYQFGERTAELLKEGVGLGGFREIKEGESASKWTGVKFESYNGMPHSACPEEIEHMGQWLEKVIPATSS